MDRKNVEVQNAEPPAVVSAHWLHEHLNTARPVIIDCRFALEEPLLGASQYQQAHIPGALYFDLNRDLSSGPQAHGGRHPLPNLNALVARLAATGISSGTADYPPSHVVVYDDSRFAFAARLWWLLRYLGHRQVSILDGGFEGWQQAGFCVTDEWPSPEPGLFTPDLQEDWVITREQIQSSSGQSGLVLVDSRTGDRYRGEYEPIDPIAGHIPGAVNYPWTDVTDEDGYVRSPQAQRQRWQNLPAPCTPVVYCGSGVTACVNLFSRHLAGLPLGRLYAGSWSDWCSYPDPPTARG